MFSSLSRGSILQGIDRLDGMKWFTGSVERVTPVADSVQHPFNSLGQFPTISVDIVANINGKQREFRGIPGTNSIADFGEDSVILADNKDALYNYVKSLLQASEDATNKELIRKHEERIPKLRKVLSDMFPGTANNEEVKELKEEVSSLKSQLAEAISLLKQQGGGSKSGAETTEATAS